MFTGQTKRVIALDGSQRSHQSSTLDFRGLAVARATVSDSGMRWPIQLQDWLVRSVVKLLIDRLSFPQRFPPRRTLPQFDR